MLARLASLAARLRFAFSRRRLDEDAKTEFEAHLELLAGRYLDAGMTREDAQAAARRQFGNRLLVREDLYQMNSIGWLDGAATNLRQALRALRRRPAYAAALVATVSVGIAASTAVFSVVDAVLFKPLPFLDASELVALWQHRNDVGASPAPMSPANVVDWTRQATSFSSVGLWTADFFTVAGDGDGERVPGAAVSGTFFATLGVPAALGRTFTSGDEGRPEQVVLSDAVWRRLFGADPRVVGANLYLNNRPFTVAGVMPRTFVFPKMAIGDVGFQPELFVPLEMSPRMMGERGAQFMLAIGRLRPGVAVASAQREAATIATRLETAYPQVNAGRGALVVPLHEQVVGRVRTPLLLVLAAAAILLLISCFNVASMLVARAVERSGEIGVRLAMGASRSKLLAHFMAESLVVFALGGVAAMLLVSLLQHAFVAFDPALLPRLNEVTLDARVLAFGAGLSLLTSVAFGAMPLVHAVSPDVAALLDRVHRGLTGSSRARLVRNGLIVAEIAVALVLLVGAALMARTLMNLDATNLGFEPDAAATFDVSLPTTKYQRRESPAVFQRLLDRIQAVPGVEAAGAINVIPLAATGFTWTFEAENHPLPAGSPPERVDYRVVTPGIFSAMRIPLRGGRLIADTDDAASPAVAMINEAMVRRFWPREDPLGQRIRIQGPPTDWFRWATIVGIVGDVRGASVDRPAAPAIYRPLSQHPYTDMAIVVRARTDALSLVGAIRARAQDVSPDLRLYNVQRFDAFVSRSTALRRSITVVTVVFAGAALFLVAVGIYGLVATVVAQRFTEMGIRMAFGAGRNEVVWTLMRTGIALMASGLVLGLVITLAAMPVLSGVLFGVTPTDPVAYGVAAVVLALIGLLATYVPARTVSRFDPARALRFR
jgi:putative ABC transport system permease protein